ncbi:MAG: DUF5926 family protein [Nocardioidaceae bacterium]
MGCWRRSGTSSPAPGPEVLEEPAADFAAALAEALADGSPLSAEERAARSGWRTGRSRSADRPGWDPCSPVWLDSARISPSRSGNHGRFRLC